MRPTGPVRLVEGAFAEPADLALPRDDGDLPERVFRALADLGEA